MFVIAIVGILSVVLAPNFQRDTLQEAANQLVSHIRYTQHLAMMDNQFDINDASWFKGRWQLHFGQSSAGTKHSDGEYQYAIYSDAGAYSGSPGISELAKNPINTAQLMSGGYSNVIHWDEARATKKLNLGKSYGIKDIQLTGSCAVTSNTRRIAFDVLGRPIIGNISSGTVSYMSGNVSGSPLRSRCQIDICIVSDCTTAGIDEKISISIEAETGYTHIL